MPFEFILTERFDGVAVITLNRPDKLNALSFPLVRELDEALSEYENDEDIKAVILTGAGERAFSAGADIHEMAGLTSEELAPRQEVRGHATWHIATFAKPLIGAINGLAYGGAALLSSTLDLRIGCERTAFRFLAASYGRVNCRSRGAPPRHCARDGPSHRQERCAHGAGDQAAIARGGRHGLARPLQHRGRRPRHLARGRPPARRVQGIPRPQDAILKDAPQRHGEHREFITTPSLRTPW